jgi:hypothetical protein
LSGVDGEGTVGQLPQCDQKRRGPKEAGDEGDRVCKTRGPRRLWQEEQGAANLEGQGPSEISPDCKVEEGTKQAGEGDKLCGVGDDILNFVLQLHERRGLGQGLWQTDQVIVFVEMDGGLGQSEEQELGAEEDGTLVQLGTFVRSTKVRASKEGWENEQGTGPGR